jgi:hypothetical protein
MVKPHLFQHATVPRSSKRPPTRGPGCWPPKSRSPTGRQYCRPVHVDGEDLYRPTDVASAPETDTEM